MKSNYKRIGKYIRLVDERNEHLKVKTLLGLSISKAFIPSVANIIGTDMANYKIIRKNQFACSTMQVRRDGKMPVALLKDFDEAIISPAYPVFEVIDPTELLPEYLMMWMTRSEFDREACFYAIGGVRGSLEWEDFCDMQLPIPHPDKQRELVKEYNTIANRINLNNQLIQKLEETAQAIYKQWFVDFEFPDENGRPYKSSGGEMVWCEELGKEVPLGWEYLNIGAISTIKAGGDKPDIFTENKNINYNVPVYSNSSANKGLLGYTTKATVHENCITVSARGAIIGYTEMRTEPFVPIVRLIVVIPKRPNNLCYLYDTIKKFRYDDSGSAQGQLTVPEVSQFKVLWPFDNILNSYQLISFTIAKSIFLREKINIELENFKNVLLSKIVIG